MPTAVPPPVEHRIPMWIASRPPTVCPIPAGQVPDSPAAADAIDFAAAGFNALKCAFPGKPRNRLLRAHSVAAVSTKHYAEVSTHLSALWRYLPFSFIRHRWIGGIWCSEAGRCRQSRSEASLALSQAGARSALWWRHQYRRLRGQRRSPAQERRRWCGARTAHAQRRHQARHLRPPAHSHPQLDRGLANSTLSHTAAALTHPYPPVPGGYPGALADATRWTQYTQALAWAARAKLTGGTSSPRCACASAPRPAMPRRAAHIVYFCLLLWDGWMDGDPLSPHRDDKQGVAHASSIRKRTLQSASGALTSGFLPSFFLVCRFLGTGAWAAAVSRRRAAAGPDGTFLDELLQALGAGARSHFVCTCTPAST